MDVFSAAGQLIQTITDFDEGLWLDSERLVLTRYGDEGEYVYNEMRQPEGATSYLAQLGSDHVEALGENLAASRSSGAGALAVPTCWICRPNVGFYREVAFRTWTVEDGFSEALRGHAIRWSRGGDRVLVEHPLQSGPARDSWWETLSYPDMTRFARGGGLLNADLTRTVRISSAESSVARVTDLVSRETLDLPVPFDDFHVQWDASGSLLVNDRIGSAALMGMDGQLRGQWANVGHITPFSSSDDETTHVLWFDETVESTGDLAIVRHGALSRVHIPGQLYNGAGSVAPAPDGSVLAVMAYVDQRAAVLLVAL
ncbi:MAG TPA: hypothetical protein VEX62_00990 [Candidatus Limnocylindrales bacterium]|nr:hypothetical protein [Candidatus Limnocylindrales bacterium]